MQLHVPLDEVLGAKTSVRALRALTLFPEKEFTGRELAQTVGSAPSRIIVELQRLKSIGLVTRRTLGRAHVWKINTEHEMFRLLEPVFARERELPDVLIAELAAGVEDERISRAILFGSFARGTETAKSDVDLLVLTRRLADVEGVKGRLDSLSIRLSKRLGLRLSPVVHAESEVPRLRSTPLLANVAAEGRPIRGRPL